MTKDKSLGTASSSMQNPARLPLQYFPSIIGQEGVSLNTNSTNTSQNMDLPGNYEQPEDHWGFYLDVLCVPVEDKQAHKSAFLLITNTRDNDELLSL